MFCGHHLAPSEMQSGCPHIRGGVCPVFQHQRNVVALPPSRDYNVAPAPVVHRASGLCHDMGGGSVPYSPVQWQQGSAHLQQNFQGLHHIPSQACSGFQHPNLSYGQLSNDTSAYYSSAHVPALRSNYCDALAKNSERHFLCNGVQGRECWGQKASHVSVNTGQHQRDRNFAFSVGSSVAFQRDDLHVSAQASSPILRSLLAEHAPSRPPSVTTSDERHHRSQQLKSSVALLNCEKAQTQNLNHLGETHSTLCPQRMISPSPSSQPSTENSPVGELVPDTSGKVQDSYYGTVLSRQNKDATFQPDCTKLNSPDLTPTNSAQNVRRQRLASDKMDQCTGQQKLLGEKRLKDGQVNTESTAKSETGCCATCSSKKHSSEYPQIVLEVAATCTEKEDRMPVVLMAVPYAGSTLSCSSSQKGLKSLGSNISKNVNVTKQTPLGTGRNNRETGQKPVGLLRLDTVQYMMVSEDPPSRLHSEESEKRVFEITLLTENQKKKMEVVEDQQHCGRSCKEAQSDQVHCVEILKDPQYEDISDSEVSPPLIEDPQYEDISEDERPRIESIAEERPLYQRSVSCSPPTVVVEDETDDEMEDDWIAIPISISDLKLEPAEDDLGCPQTTQVDDCEDGPEIIDCDESPTDHETCRPSSSKLKEFDTLESFIDAMGIQSLNKFEVVARWPKPECGEQRSPQNGRESFSESADGIETEDSCDYSSGSERNYLTVSRRMLKSSAPLSSELDSSESENESEEHDVIIVRDSHKSKSGADVGGLQKPEELITTKNAKTPVRHEAKEQKSPKDDVIIILDSDSEDENDQNGNEKTTWKDFCSSDKSGDEECRPQRRRSPETADSSHETSNVMQATFTKNRRPSADAAAPYHPSKQDAQLRGVTQEASSEQLVGSKGVSEHDPRHKQQNLAKDNIIILDSDTEGESDQDDHCLQPKVQVTESVEETHGTVKEKARKTRPPSLDSVCERLSKLHNIKSVSEHFQHETNGHERSDREASRRPKGMLSSVWKDNGTDLFGEPKKHKTIKKPSRPVPEGADFTSGPTPGVQKSSKPTKLLKCLKKSRVHSAFPEAPTAGSMKDKQRTDRSEKQGSVFKPEHAKHGHHSATHRASSPVARPSLASGQVLPCQDSPSTSTGHSSFTNGRIFIARQSSASSQDVCQAGAASTSTSDQPVPPTTGPSYHMQKSSAKRQVTKDWQDSFFPTRIDRKSSLVMHEESLATSNVPRRKDRRRRRHSNRAPRQQHNSHEPETPLMKKTKFDAVQWTKAINRDPPRQQSFSVGDGYKWSEKRALDKSRKGSSR